MDAETYNSDEECQQMAEALSAHFDGVAEESAQIKVVQHLQSCSSCRRMWHEWQELKDMERCALQPFPDGVVPLAPVRPPRHLREMILHQTSRAKAPWWRVSWQHAFIGTAIPAAIAACAVLFVLKPWQQNVPSQMKKDALSAMKNATVLDADRLASLPAQKATSSLPTSTESATKKAANSSVTAPRKTVVSNSTSADSHAVNVTVKNVPVRLERSSPVVTRISKNIVIPAKSTFQGTTSTRRVSDKKYLSGRPTQTPQVSLVSADLHSRAVEAVKKVSSTIPPQETTVPSVRLTALHQTETPIAEPETRVAEAPNETSDDEYTEDSDPVRDYITAHEEHPSEIRQAVESYRAALVAVRLNVP